MTPRHRNIFAIVPLLAAFAGAYAGSAHAEMPCNAPSANAAGDPAARRLPPPMQQAVQDGVVTEAQARKLMTYHRQFKGQAGRPGQPPRDAMTPAGQGNPPPNPGVAVP